MGDGHLEFISLRLPKPHEIATEFLKWSLQVGFEPVSVLEHKAYELVTTNPIMPSDSLVGLWIAIMLIDNRNELLMDFLSD